MQIDITQERPDSADAMALIGELEAHLEARYPRESRHGFSVEKLIRDGVIFFVTRVDAAPAGCGGVKIFDEYGEVKRMYVRLEYRGLGLGRRMLDQLAGYCRRHGIDVLRLETGVHQMEAIRLYEAYGFQRIAPFPPYFEDPLSRCYEMRLAPDATRPSQRG